MNKLISLISLSLITSAILASLSSGAFADDVKPYVTCNDAFGPTTQVLQVSQDSNGDFQYTATVCNITQAGNPSTNTCVTTTGEGDSVSFGGGCGGLTFFYDSAKSLELSFRRGNCRYE
jgi:hypothetical protein